MEPASIVAAPEYFGEKWDTLSATLAWIRERVNNYWHNQVLLLA